MVKTDSCNEGCGCFDVIRFNIDIALGRLGGGWGE